MRSGAEFYRSEIGRRSTMIRRALIWSFAPTLLAIGTFILSIATGGNTFRKALPFITLVFVWVARLLRRQVVGTDQASARARQLEFSR